MSNFKAAVLGSQWGDIMVTKSSFYSIYNVWIELAVMLRYHQVCNLPRPLGTIIFFILQHCGWQETICSHSSEHASVCRLFYHPTVFTRYCCSVFITVNLTTCSVLFVLSLPVCEPRRLIVQTAMHHLEKYRQKMKRTHLIKVGKEEFLKGIWTKERNRLKKKNQSCWCHGQWTSDWLRVRFLS